MLDKNLLIIGAMNEGSFNIQNLDNEIFFFLIWFEIFFNSEFSAERANYFWITSKIALLHD